MPRDYKREYALFHKKPEQIKRRMNRNKARRLFLKNGLVKKGDGKDVHHKDNNPLNGSKRNLQVLDKYRNRSIK